MKIEVTIRDNPFLDDAIWPGDMDPHTLYEIISWDDDGFVGHVVFRAFGQCRLMDLCGQASWEDIKSLHQSCRVRVVPPSKIVNLRNVK